jgi:hypothetical protein
VIVQRTKRFGAWVTTTLLLWSPRVAEACPVCGVGRDDETRTAFILTTAFLTLLPLAMLGGIVWWLVRRARQLEASWQDAASATAAASVVSRSSSSR